MLFLVCFQVQTDEKFKVAFYFALRDTLVTDTLDHASLAAFGREKSGKAQWRVVTLQGEIIEQRCGSDRTVCSCVWNAVVPTAGHLSFGSIEKIVCFCDPRVREKGWRGRARVERRRREC